MLNDYSYIEKLVESSDLSKGPQFSSNIVTESCKTLLQVDFLWQDEGDVREVSILRRYHVQDRADYHKWDSPQLTTHWFPFFIFTFSLLFPPPPSRFLPLHDLRGTWSRMFPPSDTISSVVELGPSRLKSRGIYIIQSHEADAWESHEFTLSSLFRLPQDSNFRMRATDQVRDRI